MQHRAFAARENLALRAESALERDPGRPPTYEPRPKVLLLYSLASLHKTQGQTEASSALVNRAARMYRDNQEVPRTQRLRTAWWLNEQGWTDWAETEFRHLISTGLPENTSTIRAHNSLAELMHDRGRDGEAADVLQDCIAAMKANDQREQQGKAERDKGNRGRSVKETLARMHYFRAVYKLEQQEDVKEHVAELDRAIEQDPTDADALIALYRLKDATPERRKRTGELIQQAAQTFREQAETPLEEKPGQRNDIAELNSQLLRRASACNQFAWLVGNTTGVSSNWPSNSHASRSQLVYVCGS